MLFRQNFTPTPSNGHVCSLVPYLARGMVFLNGLFTVFSLKETFVKKKCYLVEILPLSLLNVHFFSLVPYLARGKVILNCLFHVFTFGRDF